MTLFHVLVYLIYLSVLLVTLIYRSLPLFSLVQIGCFSYLLSITYFKETICVNVSILVIYIRSFDPSITAKPYDCRLCHNKWLILNHN
jgi:hypothetical protein